MKLLIIINTSAGHGDGSIYDFMRLAMLDGDEATVRYTDGSTDAADLVDDAPLFDRVVISGGDGTIASIAYKLAHTGVPLLAFPAGTANLLASNLRIPYEPRSLAQLVREGRTCDFDLGEIDSGGMRFGFAIMAGAGYDATIMRDAVPSKKRLGAAAYFQAAFANTKPQKSTIRLVIDGNPIQTEGLGAILVNFSRIQFDIALTHETSPCDGMFDIAILKAGNAFGLIPAFIAATLDRDGGMPSRPNSLEVHRGSVVEMVADPPLPMQYDGEPLEASTPFTARALKGAARLIVPDDVFDEFARN